MCAEWAPAGVQVNAIGPGYFDTELTSALVAGRGVHAWLRAAHAGGALGAAGGARRRLLFLASPASDFVNGQILYVDGGMSAVI